MCRDISLDIRCPYMVNKLVPLFHQHFHRGSPIRTSQVLHPMDRMIDILILLKVRTCNCCTTILQVTYPVHDGQVHPHGKNSCGKMNPLGDVTREQVVEGLDPVRVSTLLLFPNSDCYRILLCNQHIPCRTTRHTCICRSSVASSPVV